jgi:E3 ubiquitin-protein ligase RNF14
LSQLCKKLDELWHQNDNQSVLFTWISFLTDELFDYLEMNIDNEIKINSGDEKLKTSELSKIDKRAIKLKCSSHLVKNYDKDQKDIKFQNSYFTCQVCFCDKSGKECMQFYKCEHTFCNECMRGYFESQINSGDVKKLTCPYEKCESQALQNQVQYK